MKLVARRTAVERLLGEVVSRRCFNSSPRVASSARQQARALCKQHLFVNDVHNTCNQNVVS